MMLFNELEDKIDFITSSKHYEGDFGDPINVDALTEFAQGRVNLEDYFKFLTTFGFGELDASFYVEEIPVLWSNIYPLERTHLDGMYIFATDQSEYSFTFDTKNDSKVFEVDASGEVSEKHLGFFEDFISAHLARLVDIVKWRTENW